MSFLARARAAFRAANDYQRFQLLGPELPPLVVYSEGPGDWPHLGPVLEELRRGGTGYAYCTSHLADPGLAVRDQLVRTFFLGEGAVRAVFFRSLACRVLLMTVPDLDVFALKRSPRTGTCVYAFHSINSTHTVYRERAFEAYDVILCVGPHHVRELRREEELKGLRPRRLLEHGSVKLDTLVREHEPFRGAAPPAGAPPMALVAPSWGEGSIAEDPALLDDLVRAIGGAAWECRLRLHPMTSRRAPGLVAALRRRHADLRGRGLFEVETDLNDNTSLQRARVMVSDWSGAATEFAFALGRPVVFVDTPRKINNPGWARFELPGLEELIRSEIGVVIAPSEVATVGRLLDTLNEDRARHASRADEARRRLIFNVGSAAEAGAAHLRSLIEEGPPHTPRDA